MAELLTTAVLVIGSGPAGIAAAVSAVGLGARVLLVDMQAQAGGQVWRGQVDKRSDATAARWLTALERSSVVCRWSTRLIDVPQAGTALFSTPSGALRVNYQQVIVATGARELLLPFRGWTLPGVFGAGGLQVLVKNGWPVAGKRVVVGGSGPLLLAAADSLRQHGANVLCIVEQTPWAALASFAAGLLRHPAKLRQAAGLGFRLRGVPYRSGSWITAAHGATKVEAATLFHASGKSQTIPCDALAVGYGLVPNLDVAAGFGCALQQGFVQVDSLQQTSVAGVYCAGEGTGIGGLDQALSQGEIAGCAAAGHGQSAGSAQARRPAQNRFAARLRDSFALRDELRSLADPATLLCRCENVTVAAVQSCQSQREAKLVTRAGMGHCQGRVCAAAGSFLFGWTASPPRPPLAPVPISQLDYSTIPSSGESA